MQKRADGRMFSTRIVHNCIKLLPLVIGLHSLNQSHQFVFVCPENAISPCRGSAENKQKIKPNGSICLPALFRFVVVIAECVVLVGWRKMKRPLIETSKHLENIAFLLTFKHKHCTVPSAATIGHVQTKRQSCLIVSLPSLPRLLDE